jgi:hypothetical protein
MFYAQWKELAMKQSTVKLIEEKFNKDISDINYQIYKNKNEIKQLAEKQKELKNTRKGLHEILSLIRNKS